MFAQTTALAAPPAHWCLGWGAGGLPDAAPRWDQGQSVIPTSSPSSAPWGGGCQDPASNLCVQAWPCPSRLVQSSRHSPRSVCGVRGWSSSEGI